MPEFAKFSREAARSREEPMFTLQARGLLSLNQAVFRRLGQPDNVELLFNESERIIALRAAEKDDPDAYTVRQQTGTSTYLVALQGFLAHHGIKTVVAQRFIAHDYGDGRWGLVLSEGRAVINRRGAAEVPPARTSRWRVTSDGFEVPSLTRLGESVFDHPGYMAEAARRETPPSMRVGALVACEPLGPEVPTSDLRQRFLEFLRSKQIDELIHSVTPIGDAPRWIPWGGHGRISLEAAFTGDSPDVGDPVAPLASALLLLPEAGKSSFGRDPRFAQLVLHVQPRGPDGQPPKPGDLANWHNRFTRALSVPGYLAGMLTERLGLVTVAEPPAQVGVWLKAAQAQDLIDLRGLRLIPGTQQSAFFMGWAVADDGGSPPSEAAVEWLRQMCDYTLHADRYEQTLGSFLLK
ncbi:MAG TPA: hypothetical protein VGS19_01100 [Streptosporangiaceae bacterium]|nr:hypothetical protein [Streptosporangiaceae bacterium]